MQRIEWQPLSAANKAEARAQYAAGWLLGFLCGVCFAGAALAFVAAGFMQ